MQKKHASIPWSYVIPLAVAVNFLLTATTTRALMPPDVYARASRESAIKTIATVMDVKTTHVGTRASSKQVTFKREYALTQATPASFTGSCKSIDTALQKKNVMPGGDLYFYPNAGDRVFVTITTDGGPITSITPMTRDLEKVIREKPYRLEYGIGKVSTPKEPETILRGKEPAPQELATGLAQLEAMDKEAFGSPESELQGALLIALGNDDIDEAATLLKQGADVNTPISQAGQTPIMAAESLKMAQLLLHHGANPAALDHDGGNAIHYAVSRKNAVELIAFFAAHGAAINAVGWDNEAPLFVAISYLHETRGSTPPPEPSPEQLLKALVAHGADVNAVDEYGNTALMIATVQDNAELVELLLSLGADLTIKGPGGHTAEETAYDLGHRYIYQLLEQTDLNNLP
ncbi:hypothetical protein DSLASN_19860 [Desulfoluna limicola]|uniref:Ankyrin n=1 Tax=Desulfoluna limicola TaxID=2810562 RepID=A0ABN6F5Q3_9BACT|nr:ankyrin repeat domain-containing protein [Desulfoluna limicola]BCS96354.1 hypothetical protein DSLASN_19860 [Desulfoluna limicola]